LSVNSKAIRVIVCGLGLMLAGATPGLAQNRRNDNRNDANRPQQRQMRRDGHHAGDWLRRYNGLPADQQQKALDNDPQFRDLQPEQQQQLRDRLQRFNSLPAQQQDRILQRMETWEHLTPEQKDKARGLAQQLKELPPDRRRVVQGAVNDLRQMSPEQRQQAINSDRFKNQFSAPERGLLTGISELPLASTDGGQGDASPEEP